MQELEDTGLTRNEILFDEPGSGVNLYDDPFFQLLKENKTAREMLIKPNEEFSADRVIEKALRQDVGVDPSMSGFRQDWRILDKDDPGSVVQHYKQKYRDTKPIVDPHAFNTGEDYVERANREFHY